MNKFILITGASKGIGHAAANALVESGWSVIGVARNAPHSFPGDFIKQATPGKNINYWTTWLDIRF